MTARRLLSVPPSALGALVAGAPAGVLDLALGSPGWPTPPEPILRRAQSAGPHQYADVRGDAALRARIAVDAGADPDTEVTVTVGATEALSVALLTLLDPGDEVVVVSPFYENFVAAAGIAGAVPRFVRTRAPHWRLDREDLLAAIGPRTRVLLLNTPNNPSGHVLDASEWAMVAEVCDRYGLTVVCDEVYASYVFDGRAFISAADVPGLAGRYVVVGSLSKSHALSGWRLGWLRADAALTASLRTVHMALTGGAAAPLQRAAAHASPSWDPGPGMHALRDLAVSAVRAGGLECLPPEGGCYLLTAVPDDCASFAHRLASEAGVLVVPGRYFHEDRDAGSGFVRVAFNRPAAQLEEAGRRLGAWKVNQ